MIEQFEIEDPKGSDYLSLESDGRLSTKAEDGPFLAKGTISSAVFTVVKTSIGAGILGLPYINTRLGMMIGIFYIILGGIVNYHANLYLS